MSESMQRLGGVLRSSSLWALLLPIRFYRRWISPALPASCRFYPTCAGYAEEALRLHSPVRGGWLALRRLGRCHPWTPGGVDHVPGSPHDPMAVPEPTAAHPSTLTGA